ncbi:hypothetical protein Csa_022508, partial [Cucumis sativus]
LSERTRRRATAARDATGRDATTATWGGRAANGVLPLVDYLLSPSRSDSGGDFLPCASLVDFPLSLRSGNGVIFLSSQVFQRKNKRKEIEKLNSLDP